MLPKVLEQYTGGQISRDSESLLFSEDGFSEMIIQFFRSCVDDSVFDNCRDQYHLFRRSLDHFEPFLSNGDFLDVYIEVLFSLFELFRVIASRVARNVVDVFILRKLMHCPAKPLVLKLFENPLFNSFFNIDVSFGKELPIEILYRPFLFHDLQATQRLLRYGAHFKMDADSLRTCLMDLYGRLTREIMPEIFHKLVLESDFKRITMAYPTFEEQRRLHFVLVAVFSTKHKEQRTALPILQKRIDILKIVFKTIQEPFITVSEITRFLDLSLAGETKERDIRQFCENFIEDFPRGAQSSAPRSLKHLCRCTIRQSLTISSRLPYGVFMLNIPTKLKDYLLLQRYQSEFYPKYVAALSTLKRPLSDVPSSKRQKTALS